jgi:hypothetical protein
MEKPAETFAIGQSGRPTQEHKECGLKRIVCIGDFAEYPATGAEYHAAVSSNQRRERGLIAVADELSEQFSIRGGVLGLPARHPPQGP